MKTLALLALIATGLTFISQNTHAEDIFKIEIGRDYKEYGHSELQRRVWELERAVWQLQQRVFQLESGGRGMPVAAPAPVDSWVCTINAMGEDFTGTGATKALATAKSMENCKSKQNNGFFCKNPKCEQ